MARRQESMLDIIFSLLKIAPVWVGPVLAAAVFAFIRWAVPAMFSGTPGKIDTTLIVRPLSLQLCWVLAGVVLVAWIAAEIYKLSNRKLLDDQPNRQTIGNLTWTEFERLVCEAYRRQGFIAEVVGSPSGDGGVDVKLTRGSEVVLVQCKHWKSYKVGVTTIRELLGVVVSQGATKGILVTSGSYTRDAKEFAAKNAQIELIDGPALFELIQQVREELPAQLAVQTVATTTPPCPSCGSSMVLRLARKGVNAGNEFCGCPRYPACRGVVNV